MDKNAAERRGRPDRTMGASSRLGFLKRLVLAGIHLLVPLHTGLLLAYYLVRWLGGQDFWFIDALSYILPWLFVPTVLLLPLSWLAHRRVWRIIALVPVLLFVGTYGALFCPRIPAPVTSPAFTAMTYNVLYLNSDVDGVVASIEAQDADIVGLRELTPEVAAPLAERLALRYPHHRLDTWCGLWTRLPILAYESFLLDEGRGQPAQQALVDVGGRAVTVLSVHPRSPPLRGFHLFGLPLGIPTGFFNQGRDADMRSLLARIDQIEGPMVVIGDLNLTDQQSLYPALMRRLRDAHREAGWGMGFTFTRFRGLELPMWRIDYVLHTPDLVAVRTAVGEYGGSDHRPVWAELGFVE